MRLLADENFPRSVVEALRARGHDVAWIRTDAPGSSDHAVLAHAVAESRVLITFDKDFGELAFRQRRPSAMGLVLFRIALRSPMEIAGLVAKALESRDDWAGHFSVVEVGRIRMTALPDPPEPS